MKTFNSCNLKNKTVLLRVDINSELKNRKILMSKRIEQSAETINLLKKKKAKVVVIAHQGRQGKKDLTSLKQHSKLLNRFTKIKFVKDIIGKKAVKKIKKLKSGEALLLENIRTLDDEFKPGKNNFVKKLSSLCDVYINDAFSVCQRKHSSIISFPKYMESFAGPFLYKEFSLLKKINLKNTLYILAGSKPWDNIKLLGRNNKVLVGGVFSLLCLIAKGKKLGISERELRKNIKDFNKLIKEIKKNLKNIEVPVDFVMNVNGERKEISVDELPSNYMLFDIGKETIKKYSEKIKKSKTIYMKGPMGVCEYKKFCKGTKDLLRAISKNKNFSLIGGGHLSIVVDSMRIPERKFGHLSLSGGALLRYIAGDKLPGLEALK